MRSYIYRQTAASTANPLNETLEVQPTGLNPYSNLFLITRNDLVRAREATRLMPVSVAEMPSCSSLWKWYWTLVEQASEETVQYPRNTWEGCRCNCFSYVRTVVTTADVAWVSSQVFLRCETVSRMCMALRRRTVAFCIHFMFVCTVTWARVLLMTAKPDSWKTSLAANDGD